MLIVLIGLIMLIILMTALLVPFSRAQAANLDHHDLTSLALESDAVVLARVTSLGIDGARLGGTHEVIDVFAGELAIGDVLELDYGALRFVDRWDDAPPWGTKQPADEVLLFLCRSPQDRSWQLCDSGLRVFVDDRVYRFEQSNNPGPYVPRPQGHDPYDVFGDPRSGPGLTRAEFEPELRAAVERAALVRAALTEIDTLEGRAKLLEFVGPAWGEDRDEPFAFDDRNFQDLVAAQIITALSERGHEDTLLDAISRLRGGVRLYGIAGIAGPYSRWLEVARDPTQALARRLAALSVLRHRLASDTAAATFEQLVKLLDDPDPRIRAAVAAVTPAQGNSTPAWRAAMLERIRIEREPAVLCQLVETAVDQKLEISWPDAAWPIVTAERRGLGFELRWLDPNRRWDLADLLVEAEPVSGELRTLTTTRDDLRVSGSGPTMQLRGWLLFDPPLVNQPTRLQLVARVQHGGERRELRVDLRGLGVPPEPMQVAAELAREPVREPEPSATPPGCACASTSPSGGSPWLLVLAALSLRALQSRGYARERRQLARSESRG